MCVCVICTQGVEAKVVLDAVIDACGAMQNLREGIFSYRSRFLKEAREKQRNVLINVCLVSEAHFCVCVSVRAPVVIA